MPWLVPGFFSRARRTEIAYFVSRHTYIHTPLFKSFEKESLEVNPILQLTRRPPLARFHRELENEVFRAGYNSDMIDTGHEKPLAPRAKKVKIRKLRG